MLRFPQTQTLSKLVLVRLFSVADEAEVVAGVVGSTAIVHRDEPLRRRPKQGVLIIIEREATTRRWHEGVLLLWLESRAVNLFILIHSGDSIIMHARSADPRIQAQFKSTVICSLMRHALIWTLVYATHNALPLSYG